MKKIYIIIIIFSSLIFKIASCKSIYDSDFMQVRVDTINPNDTKINSINYAIEKVF